MLGLSLSLLAVVHGAPAGSTHSSAPRFAVIHLTPADDLVAALTNATAGDELVLADGTYKPSATLDINKDITIRAMNEGRAVIDGQNARRVLLLQGGVVHLDGLNITGGHVNGFGAGVYFRKGTATLNACSIFANSATYGGGVGVGGGYVKMFQETTIHNNSVDTSGMGGGLYVFGYSTAFDTVTFTRCDIHSNTAHLGGGVGFYEEIVTDDTVSIHGNSPDDCDGEAATPAACGRDTGHASD